MNDVISSFLKRRVSTSQGLIRELQKNTRQKRGVKESTDGETVNSQVASGQIT